jgi:hypothetical protein
VKGSKGTVGTSKTPTSDHSRPRLLGTRAVQLARRSSLSSTRQNATRWEHLPATGRPTRQALPTPRRTAWKLSLPCQQQGIHWRCGALNLREWSIDTAKRGLSDCLQVREARRTDRAAVPAVPATEEVESSCRAEGTCG